MNPLFTIGSGWVEQYLSGMVLLNFLLGQPTATRPVHAPDMEALPQILNEIAEGRYRPERHFQTGNSIQPAFVVSPPHIVDTESYTVIILNASTPTSDTISVKTGGILFEDPALAILAAHALSRNPHRAAPLGHDVRELWNMMHSVATVVRDGRYSPADFFGPVTGFVGSPTPEFHLIQVSGAKLNALRARGIQSFGAPPPPKFYLLFQVPRVR